MLLREASDASEGVLACKRHSKECHMQAFRGSLGSQEHRKRGQIDTFVLFLRSLALIFHYFEAIMGAFFDLFGLMHPLTSCSVLLPHACNLDPALQLAARRQ